MKPRTAWGHLWRFLAIGMAGAVIDYGVYISLTRRTGFFASHLVAANTIAFLAANANSFYWNRQWNFGGGKPAGKQYLTFVSVSLVYLAVIQSLFWVLIAQFHVFDLLAKAMAIGFALTVYFTVLRQWVFARREGPIIGV